jgi:hypothetical protein
VAIDDLIESMRDEPAQGNGSAADIPAPKAETPRNAPELRLIGKLPCTLVSGNGDDKTVVGDFAGVANMDSLCAKIRAVLSLADNVVWHLAYVDNDGDEVLLPDLDADGFTEVTEFAKQLKVHTD